MRVGWLGVLRGWRDTGKEEIGQFRHDFGRGPGGEREIREPQSGDDIHVDKPQTKAVPHSHASDEVGQLDGAGLGVKGVPHAC